jgi:hypothetical protein
MVETVFALIDAVLFEQDRNSKIEVAQWALGGVPEMPGDRIDS